jgi:hypothetical protein
VGEEQKRLEDEPILRAVDTTNQQQHTKQRY